MATMCHGACPTLSRFVRDRGAAVPEADTRVPWVPPKKSAWGCKECIDEDKTTSWPNRTRCFIQSTFARA